MGRQTLRLSTIREINNGRIEEAVNQALVRVGRDLVERPHLTEERAITLTIFAKPKGEGDMEEGTGLGEVRFKVTEKIPSRESNEFVVGVSGNGVITINPDSPEDPSQSTLDELTKS